MDSWTPDQRGAILRKSFDARAMGDMRLVMLDDGPARGQRLLQLRTANGLEAEIALDKGFDIASLRFRGINIGWLGPNRHPAPVAPEDDLGLGLLRAFDGFLVTCGLDHHGLPGAGPADHFNYPNRKEVVYPLHGRVATIPAVLEHRCIDLDGEVPSIRCTGVVRQAALFAEVLELRRTVTMPLLGNSIVIEDLVTNRGATPARHGMLYHINLGYPLLDEATVVSGLKADTLADWCKFPPCPRADAIETFELARPANLEQPEVTVFNPTCDGITLKIRYSHAELPAIGVWQAFQSGIFALGIEPQTVLAPPAEPYTEGHASFMKPGDTRHYRIEINLSLA